MRNKIKVGVVGYGVIGQRLADAVMMQDDMELVGVSDVAPTLTIRALKDSGMRHKLYLSDKKRADEFTDLDIKTEGNLEELVQECDIILDATPAGIGEKNKVIYEKYKKHAIFQGGESDSIAETFFHGTTNYEEGLGKQFLKLTSCNTTGLIRTISALNANEVIEEVVVTIIRRVADPGDYHRGLTNALQIEPAPSHQVMDLMNIMPNIKATGILVHTPVTHGHIITILVRGKTEFTKEILLQQLKKEPRIKVVSTKDGFLGNASFYKYARELGNIRGDMYEVGLWEDSITTIGNSAMFAINIPQESVTIPDTIDAIRASLSLQSTQIEANRETNMNLNIPGL